MLNVTVVFMNYSCKEMNTIKDTNQSQLERSFLSNVSLTSQGFNEKK